MNVGRFAKVESLASNSLPISGPSANVNVGRFAKVKSHILAAGFHFFANKWAVGVCLR